MGECPWLHLRTVSQKGTRGYKRKALENPSKAKR